VSYRAVGIATGYGSISLGESVAIAEEADRAGLGLVGAGDGFVENCATMGALAARTERVELFTAILGWTRTPVTVALAASTLQELAGGRYRLGIGAMPRQWSERWHDVDYTRPADRMRDFVAAIRAAWAAVPGSPSSYEGSHYRFRDYERLSQHAYPPPPIYLGVTLERMTQLAGEVADGAIFNTMTSIEWLRDVSYPALERGFARAGRTRDGFDAGRLIYTAIAPTREEAVELIRPSLAFYLEVPYFADLCRYHGFDDALERGQAARGAGDEQAAVQAIPDEMVDAFALAGTVDEVLAAYERYDALLDWTMLTVPIGHDRDTTLTLARRIIAAFGTTDEGRV
jgi:alkanesulfonate monooxygenase SsuD/methylene tetrahydromethanopterin reductase-like flavin-dependent oxidoreductase (luciferase family)